MLISTLFYHCLCVLKNNLRIWGKEWYIPCKRRWSTFLAPSERSLVKALSSIRKFGASKHVSISFLVFSIAMTNFLCIVTFKFSVIITITSHYRRVTQPTRSSDIWQVSYFVNQLILLIFKICPFYLLSLNLTVVNIL